MFGTREDFPSHWTVIVLSAPAFGQIFAILCHKKIVLIIIAAAIMSVV